MWAIPERFAGEEIGEEELRRLKRLRKWLYGNSCNEEICFRTAPSLVARSEVELFNISMPRFAFRAYLTDRSFVNARRIETFCKMATSWGPAPLDDPGSEFAKSPKDAPGERIRGSSSCIGDSLLEVPERLAREQYHVLTTELGLAYGERKPIRGTPFVNHIRLGGGMCAQAVCFMATALLQQAARGIYGVAEITTLASADEERRIDLGGMTPDKMCHYFNHPGVGLSALPQRIGVPDGDVDLKGISLRRFAGALRAYLLSDVPVILRVDLGRMCGISFEMAEMETPTTDAGAQPQEGTKRVAVNIRDECIYGNNGLLDLHVVKSCRKRFEERLQGGVDAKAVPEEEKKPQDHGKQGTGEGAANEPREVARPHAVLVVGLGNRDRDDRDRFLINDPTTYPFLEASALELAQARQYIEGGEITKGRLGPIQFISVAPQEIRLPLMNASTGGVVRTGLSTFADVLQIFSLRLGLPEFVDHGGWLGDFRLVDLRWCSSTSTEEDARRFENRLAHLSAAALDFLTRLVRKGAIPAKWCWLQYGSPEAEEGPGASVWIWDATAPTPPESLMDPETSEAALEVIRDKYLMSVLVRDMDGWQAKYPAPEAAAPRLPITAHHGWTVPQPACVGLRPALISSFRTHDVERVQPECPEGTAVDLYVFMQPEVERWLRRNPPLADKCGNATSAVEVMAGLADDKKAIDDWAKEITKYFSSEQGRPIVALTSFVPEVTSIQPDTCRQAREALRFLVRFACALNENGQPLRTIEMVAGSRMDGIWPSVLAKDRYTASRTEDDAARQRLLFLLEQVLAEYADQKAQHRVFLSVELEPGPIFLLRNWQSLLRLCQGIDKDPLLSKFVGVNLDIAHWNLAKDISPQRVWDTPEVRNRIVHAHIAGHHHCSHLGDLHLSDLNTPKDFRLWIDLLRRIAADWRDPDLPQFSGWVSLEYEAAKHQADVEDSFMLLTDLLQRTWEIHDDWTGRSI